MVARTRRWQLLCPGPSSAPRPAGVPEMAASAVLKSLAESLVPSTLGMGGGRRPPLGKQKTPAMGRCVWSGNSQTWWGP